MKSILFITTTNLSTNPRLLKEIQLVSKAGYDFEFLAFNLGGWSDKTELGHLSGFRRDQYTYLSASKKEFFGWVISTLIWKACILLSNLFRKSLWINSISHNKRTWSILQFLKRRKNTYNLVIAHNLGALYPAYSYSKKHKIPFIFDIEDYHPGEKCSKEEKKRREFLMKKLLPFASCITYASPLIGEYSFELIDSFTVTDKQPDDSESSETNSLIKQNNRILVTNSFSQNEFSFKENNSEKVKFVWFSQNINENRGLELVIPALEKFHKNVELILIGSLNSSFYENFLSKYTSFVITLKPLLQKDLDMKLCEFDVGLAIELNKADFNRQICLTNKIFAYAQAGAFILATNTLAQSQFISENPQLGILSAQNIPDIEKQIDWIVQNIDNIRAGKAQRFEYAKKLSWENESLKLQEIWKKIF